MSFSSLPSSILLAASVFFIIYYFFDFTSTNEKINEYTLRYQMSLGIPVDLNDAFNAITAGWTMVHISNPAVYGDNLRDKYATVMLLNNSQEEAELYSINLEVSASKLDPSS